MQSKPTSDAAILDTWREQGADRLDPLAFHYLVALQRRMADHDGDTRRKICRHRSMLMRMICSATLPRLRRPDTLRQLRHLAS